MRLEDMRCPDCGSLPTEHGSVSHPEAPPGAMATRVPKCNECGAVWYGTSRILVSSGPDSNGHRMTRWIGNEKYSAEICELTPRLKHEIREWLAELIAEGVIRLPPIAH